MVTLKQNFKNIQVDPWTIQQALCWAGSFLQEKVPDPRLSAEVLLGSVRGLNRPGLIVHFDHTLPEKEKHQFQEKIFRRADQEPIAYLVGQKEFWSLQFTVNPQVLIPRPETELLVEQAILIASSRPAPMVLVELGTGSGAVAVALAKSLNPSRTTRILATDISVGAINAARKNIDAHGLGKTIHLVQGDWLTPFSTRSRWIDLLISNPPYISELEMRSLPKTVKRYEPIKALYGGSDGLEALRQIIAQAANQLNPGGWLLLEIGETQGPRIKALAQQYPFSSITVLRDHAGKDRILKASYHG